MLEAQVPQPDTVLEDPREGPTPPFPEETQELPGLEHEMEPRPDFGAETYVGHDRLAGLATIVTGGDSGIGRAVALAFAREGADVVISYLDEHEDAQETCRYVEAAGRRVLAIPGDIGDEAHCQAIVEQTLEAFGRLDVLVNNAAHQREFEAIEDISTEEWRHTMATNLDAMFYLSRAAVPHMKPGASIINTASIIRVNCVAPGPVWTPLIAASFDPQHVSTFGEDKPLGRPAQPAELAPVFVTLASPEASYVTGAIWPVTGGVPMP